MSACPCQMMFFNHKYIENIYFFEVNTKYTSSSVLKTSDFSRVHSIRENPDVFNSGDEIYIWYLQENFLFFLFYTFY